jgi:ribosomal protein S18 acetylase RimI-like enzyme
VTTVRRLAPRDADDETLLERLAFVINRAYGVGEAGMWRDDTPRTSTREVSQLVRAGELLIARDGAEIVGCARTHLLDGGTADLGFVSAVPERQGTGIGRDLLNFAEADMRARGVGTMQLELLVPRDWTHPAKQRLRAWYERLGYEVVRTAPFEEIATHAASDLATPCEFLVFRKPLQSEPPAG